jgi:hypothetical protein
MVSNNLILVTNSHIIYIVFMSNSHYLVHYNNDSWFSITKMISLRASGVIGFTI